MHPVRRTPFVAALAFAAFSSGCLLQRGGAGTLISSANSDYSPVVSFTAKVSVTDSVRVSVDRVRIIAPGEVFEGATPSTGEIEMQALLVSANPAANGGGAATFDRNGTAKPWIERSASRNVKVADSLYMGVPVTSGPLQFALTLPPDVERSNIWLVFRITGPARMMAARMADGSAPPVFKLPDLRVFACSAKNLDGKTDKARAKTMASEYSSAC